MSVVPGAAVISDPSASGGQAVLAYSPGGGVSGRATFPTSGTYTFTFAGREDAYNGDAHVSLYLDGSTTPAGGIDVTNRSGYTTYTISVPVSAGSHSFQLLFDNDAYGGTVTTDRNAYVDYVAITHPATP